MAAFIADEWEIILASLIFSWQLEMALSGISAATCKLMKPCRNDLSVQLNPNDY